VKPEHLKVLPGALVVVGEHARKDEEASGEEVLLLDSSGALRSDQRDCFHFVSLRSVSVLTLIELRSRMTIAAHTGNPTRARARAEAHSSEMARRENLNVRPARAACWRIRRTDFRRSPVRSIADEMEHWLASNGCDGFNIMFPYLPRGCR